MAKSLLTGLLEAKSPLSVSLITGPVHSKDLVLRFSRAIHSSAKSSTLVKTIWYTPDMVGQNAPVIRLPKKSSPGFV